MRSYWLLVLIWLVVVITLVLALRHSIEIRSKRLEIIRFPPICKYSLTVFFYFKLYWGILSVLWNKIAYTVKNIWKSYIWTADKDMNESDPRSGVHYLGSSENKAWKKFRPVRDLNPWPLRYRCRFLFSHKLRLRIFVAESIVESKEAPKTEFLEDT